MRDQYKHIYMQPSYLYKSESLFTSYHKSTNFKEKSIICQKEGGIQKFHREEETKQLKNFPEF